MSVINATPSMFEALPNESLAPACAVRICDMVRTCNMIVARIFHLRPL